MLETTADLNKQTIDKLQDLIKINIDSSNGFKEVADIVDDSSLKSLFNELATTRSNFASELRNYVKLNDEEAQDSGSILAKFHRWWIDARAAVQDDEKVALVEAEKGEDQIKAKYEEVLKEIPGNALNDVIQKQYVEVKAGHDRVRDLRDQYLKNN